jgi:hypothetical protein
LDNDPYGDEQNISRLKDLAERLLDYDYYVDTDSGKPQLFLGELPTDLPADIPVPEGLILLGGLRRRNPWQREPDAQVILEAEAEPGGVYAAFREHLAGSEWSEKQWPPVERGGFVSTSSRMRPLTFCISPRGPALSVSAYRRREAGTTEVRLRLESSSSRRDSPCSDDYGRYVYDERSVIPALFPPEGVAQISGGGGSGSGSEENYAHLRTGMPPAALVGHYSAQLEEAGWSRVGGGEEGPTAWSGWTFEDEDEGWVGTFVAMSPPGPSEVCFVQVSASAMPEELR